ncbi:MAG TPA: hypothetical protein ENN54_03375 [Thermoplasmatales archaeon]|nr:hypothetical protein [Thermoplasmatales archaeon]
MKARIIWTDFMASFRGFYRNKGTLFFSIAFPVILILLFGAIFSGGGTGTYTVHVKNFDYDNGENMPQMMGNSTALQQFLGNHSNFYDPSLTLLYTNFAGKISLTVAPRRPPWSPFRHPNG